MTNTRNQATGILLLNKNVPANRSNVVVSGYQKGLPNYALSNFAANPADSVVLKKGYTFNDPTMGIITFPTSEHYLHFQKLSPEAKPGILLLWQNYESPAAILKGIRNTNSELYIPPKNYVKGAFDPKWWDGNKTDLMKGHRVLVQMQINAAKYKQSQEFRNAIDKAIKLGEALADGKGPACVIEDTGSADLIEENWGTGPTGEGTNILGISQQAFAILLTKNPELKRQLQDPNAPDPTMDLFQNQATQDALLEAEGQYKALQPTLKATRSSCVHAIKQPDTSTLPNVQELPIRGNKVSLPLVVAHAMPPVTPLPTNLTQQITQASDELVRQMQHLTPLLPQATDAMIIRKGNIVGTLKVGFKNKAEAKKFLDSLTAKGIHTATLFDDEKYPMNAKGEVVAKSGTNATYKYVVRFENPPQALDYFNDIGVANSSSIYNTIMSPVSLNEVQNPKLSNGTKKLFNDAFDSISRLGDHLDKNALRQIFKDYSDNLVNNPGSDRTDELAHGALDQIKLSPAEKDNLHDLIRDIKIADVNKAADVNPYNRPRMR